MARYAHMPWLSVAVLVLLLMAADGFESRGIAARAKASDTLDKAVAGLVNDTFGARPCAADIHRTLGLWVFEEDKIPIGAAAAKRLHEELVHRLLAARPSCVDVLDSAGIGGIITYLSKSGAIEKNGGSLIAALNDAHQNVDLIALPSMYSQAGKTVLVLRTLDRASGSTLALTAPVVVPQKYLGQELSDTATTLDAALQAASKYLVDNTSNLTDVRRLGIFFEDTGAQPAAGRYMMDQLIVNLTRDASNIITGEHLNVRGLTIKPVPQADGSVGAQDLDPPVDDAYDLSGRYWICGDAVDVQFSLRRGGGATVAWQGRVQISDFKDLELRPSKPIEVLHDVPKGAFAFQVTSPKGTAPIYRSGDELTLFLRLGQDASVYCFYIDSRGGVLPVLPNKFASNGPNANRFSANALYRLPDAARDPFKLVFTSDTSGQEMVVCFASTRDVRTDLPDTLFPDKIGPVPFLTFPQLRELFANLKDTKVSEASVTVTVAR